MGQSRWTVSKEPLSAHVIYDLVSKYGSQGVPLSDVADLLGHSSLDTTRIYTKANEGDLQAIVARLELS